MITIGFIDEFHAANKNTRKSHTRYILFINQKPIFWYSKKQKTVESRTFPSEFISLKDGFECALYTRLKLRMFGIPMIEGHATKIFCDNESVAITFPNIKSALNKNKSSIVYHYIQWDVASGIITIAWIKYKENLLDAFTKRLSETLRNCPFRKCPY